MEKKQEKYNDIMNCKHPISKKHPQMSLQDRAAQFAPFAALSGHNDAIKETARLTQRRRELSEEEKEQLDVTLLQILSDPKKNDQILITYFVEDLKKEGGNYRTILGKLKRIDAVGGRLILENHTNIMLKDIYKLKIVEK